MIKTKIIFRGIILSIFFILLGEISLRFFLGLCHAPLYQKSRTYEYIFAPNQNNSRFGNNIQINSFSQRSREPDSTKITILGLGDSVLSGGTQSDQNNIATSIFNNQMPNYQMLNIATGSWGPDNCAAYLREKGDFNASIFFLVVSSHDAYDVMDFQPVVGNHSSYPAKQYKFAWWELLDRYIGPRLKHLFSKNTSLNPDEKVTKGIKKKGNIFNPGFNALKSISDSLQIPLIVYLHAEKTELKNGKYNTQGNEIIQWAIDNNLSLIKELDYNFNEQDYRDVIHLTDSGQKKLAQIMIEHIQKNNEF